jgi:hypothetical protein
LGGGVRSQCVPDQRGQGWAGGLNLRQRPHRGTAHADPTQVTVGQLQGIGHLQDLQGDVHAPIGVVEDQAVVNP